MTVKLTDSVLNEVRFFTSKTVGRKGKKKIKPVFDSYATLRSFLGQKRGEKKKGLGRREKVKKFSRRSREMEEKNYSINLPPKIQKFSRNRGIPQF